MVRENNSFMHALRVARYIARNSAVAVHGEKLVEFVATGLMRAADRLAYQEVEHFSWPDDLRARDIVRLLHEHSPAVAAKVINEDVSR